MHKKINKEQESEIVQLYKSESITTFDIAKRYNISPRQVQRIAKKNGVIRTIAYANMVMAKNKDYSSNRTPEHLKIKRKHISRKQRYTIISEHPWCTVCGATPEHCRLDVDHIDGNPSNNTVINLQVLCSLCNIGKR